MGMNDNGVGATWSQKLMATSQIFSLPLFNPTLSRKLLVKPNLFLHVYISTHTHTLTHIYPIFNSSHLPTVWLNAPVTFFSSKNPFFTIFFLREQVYDQRLKMGSCFSVGLKIESSRLDGQYFMLSSLFLSDYLQQFEVIY